MHLKTDPQLTIPLEGDDVEGMQRRRRRAGIDACLNRRQSKPWQGAPLLTADDEFVGQGRCGSLSREQKFLDRLKTARVNPPAPMVHPSDEGVLKAAPSLKGGSQNEYLTHISISDQTAFQKRCRIQRRLERLEWLCFDDK